MSPRDPVYLGHMLDMARKAVAKTAGVTRDSYDSDENLRLGPLRATGRVEWRKRLGVEPSPPDDAGSNRF